MSSHDRDNARAAIRAVLDAVNEGAITAAEAVGRVSADQVRAVLRPVLVPDGDFGAGGAARGEAARATRDFSYTDFCLPLVWRSARRPRRGKNQARSWSGPGLARRTRTA